MFQVFAGIFFSFVVHLDADYHSKEAGHVSVAVLCHASKGTSWVSALIHEHPDLPPLDDIFCIYFP